MADYAKYYNYLTGSGVIVADTSKILEDVQNEWKDVFGDNLSVAPETPQGRIIEMIARQRIFTLQMAAAVSNMLNLEKAYGFILDDIGSLFQIHRKSATHTLTIITMAGVDGSVIPVGTKLRSDNGDIFVNTEEYIIGTPNESGVYTTPGTVSGAFEAEESGSIPAEVGSITTIIDNVDGLETVVNNSPAIQIGEPIESDQNLRNRIKESLNINSISVLSAIKSAVSNVEGVKQVKAYENTTETAYILNDIFRVPAHGIAVIVDYDETNLSTQTVANNIAAAIYKKKTLGAGYVMPNWDSASASISQTAGSGLSDLTVDKQIFGSNIEDSGSYVFTFNGTNWTLSSNSVNLSDYGIGITGTPSEDDALTVVYVAPDGAEYIKTMTYLDEYDDEQHTVVFAIPIDHDIACTVNVKRQYYSGDDLEGSIKNAIAEFLAGNNSEVDRVDIGGTLSPFEIAAAISSVIPDIFINSITIGNVGQAQSTNIIQLGSAERLVLLPENITVNIVD